MKILPVFSPVSIPPDPLNRIRHNHSSKNLGSISPLSQATKPLYGTWSKDLHISISFVARLSCSFDTRCLAQYLTV